MSSIDLSLNQFLFNTNLDYSEYLNCLKTAAAVEVTYLNNKVNKNTTEIAFKDSQGKVTDCLFYFPGNLFNLNKDQPVQLTPGPGGSPPPSPGSNSIDLSSLAAASQVTSFFYKKMDSSGKVLDVYEVTGLSPVSPATIISILTDIAKRLKYDSAAWSRTAHRLNIRSFVGWPLPVPICSRWG